MTESNELLPCPFCGSKDLADISNVTAWPAVECQDCGAQGPCIKIKREEARDSWNRRPDLERLRAERAESIHPHHQCEAVELLVEWLHTELDSMDEEYQPWLDSFTARANAFINGEQPAARAGKFVPVEPTLEQCHAAGRGPCTGEDGVFHEGGLPDTPDERARFESYMRGHCWSFGQYDDKIKCYDTTMVRMLYGVWRDRGALAAAPSQESET